MADETKKTSVKLNDHYNVLLPAGINQDYVAELISQRKYSIEGTEIVFGIGSFPLQHTQDEKSAKFGSTLQAIVKKTLNTNAWFITDFDGLKFIVHDEKVFRGSRIYSMGRSHKLRLIDNKFYIEKSMTGRSKMIPLKEGLYIKAWHDSSYGPAEDDHVKVERVFVDILPDDGYGGRELVYDR